MRTRLGQALRFSSLPLPLLLSACCLDVVPADTGSSTGVALGAITSGGGKTSGGGATTGNVLPGGTGSGGSVTGEGSSSGGSCAYPVVASNVFPYTTLGDGWLNLDAGVDSPAAIGPEPDLLLKLHCSGERYVLIEVTGSVFGAGLGDQTLEWLAEGGLLLVIAETNNAGTGRPTDQDLIGAVTQFQLNYSLVSDPMQMLTGALGIDSWPALYIVRLSDMQIVQAEDDDGYTILQAYTVLLGEM